MMAAKKDAKPADYIEFGSDRHAALLMLKKADKEDVLQYKGWTLLDMTAYGPAASETYLREILRQKVGELENPPAPKQSDDPYQANYAPSMWIPADEGL